MKMNVVKQVSVDVEIDSKDMGVAFAVAPSDEQVSFIESAVKEFNSWGRFDSALQFSRICDEILQSEHRQEIENFFERMMFFYKSLRRDEQEVEV